jgi:hypothetical protein
MPTIFPSPSLNGDSTRQVRSSGAVCAAAVSLRGSRSGGEVSLLQEQDAIEFELGADWFERPDAE